MSLSPDERGAGSPAWLRVRAADRRLHAYGYDTLAASQVMYASKRIQLAMIDSTTSQIGFVGMLLALSICMAHRPLLVE